MINNLQFYRSNSKGLKPSVNNVNEGNISFNLTDKTIYTNAGGEIVPLGDIKIFDMLYNDFSESTENLKTLSTSATILKYANCREYDYIVIKNPWAKIGRGYNNPKTNFTNEAIVNLRRLWENRNQYSSLNNKYVYSTWLIGNYYGVLSKDWGSGSNTECSISLFLALYNPIENNHDIENTVIKLYTTHDDDKPVTTELFTPVGFDAIYGVIDPFYIS